MPPRTRQRWIGSRRNAEANTGLPTRAASGVAVVDADVREEVDGRERACIAPRCGAGGDASVHDVSLPGGRHGHYPTTPGVVQRSWQATRAGVVLRGRRLHRHPALMYPSVGGSPAGAAAGIDSDVAGLPRSRPARSASWRGSGRNLCRPVAVGSMSRWFG